MTYASVNRRHNIVTAHHSAKSDASRQRRLGVAPANAQDRDVYLGIERTFDELLLKRGELDFLASLRAFGNPEAFQ